MSTVTEVSETNDLDNDDLTYETLVSDVLENIDLSYLLGKILEKYTSEEIDSAWNKARENLAKNT